MLLDFLTVVKLVERLDSYKVVLTAMLKAHSSVDVKVGRKVALMGLL